MEPEHEVSIRPTGRQGDYATFEVTVGDGRKAGQHEVAVHDEDLARLAPGARPEELVVFAFQFLLEREPPSAIMRRFEVSVISDYFPEFEEHARKHFGGSAT